MSKVTHRFKNWDDAQKACNHWQHDLDLRHWDIKVFLVEEGLQPKGLREPIPSILNLVDEDNRVAEIQISKAEYIDDDIDVNHEKFLLCNLLFLHFHEHGYRMPLSGFRGFKEGIGKIADILIHERKTGRIYGKSW